ncbi:MAG: flagellar biosynthetic protein FliQ [Thermoleophilia bacterium]|nr:flagellar biosynthetic protein FliQ [Thermoleophilia bacterium]
MLDPTLFATMSDGDVMGIANDAIWITLRIAGPILIVGLVVGLVVSVFQAVTQIQEQTLVFIPKIIAIVAVLIIAGPWMMNSMLSYTEQLFEQIPTLVANR